MSNSYLSIRIEKVINSISIRSIYILNDIYCCWLTESVVVKITTMTIAIKITQKSSYLDTHDAYNSYTKVRGAKSSRKSRKTTEMGIKKYIVNKRTFVLLLAPCGKKIRLEEILAWPGTPIKLSFGYV